MKKLYFSILLVCTAFLGISAQTATKEEDFQSWNDVQLTAPLGKRVEVVMTGTFRFGNNVQRLVDRRIGIAFNFKPTVWLTLQPGYTNIVTTPRPGRERTENRLSFAVVYKFPFKKFTLTDRSLFERRLRSPRNATRYRNRLLFEIPLKKFYDIKFFVSEEVFYDWSLRKWSRNRFTVGIGKNLNKHLTAEIYFLRQNDGTTRPGDLNIIGTTFKLRP